MKIHNRLVPLFILFLLQGCSALKNQEFDAQDHVLFSDAHAIPEFDPTSKTTGIVASYFGTSTILFDDGTDAILIDGFYSRPSLWELVFGRIKQMPEEHIDVILDKANMSNLQAILTVHSHHDHAMDAPCIALKHSAKLVGSISSSNIKCGIRSVAALADIPIFKQGAVASDPIDVGKFKITFIRSQHANVGGFMSWLLGIGDEIKHELKMPSYFTNLKEGGSYSILLEHEQGNILVHASAGFQQGNLTKVINKKEINWLFLGVGNLSDQKDDEIASYFSETLGQAKPQYLVPIHWDDFTRYSEETLYPAKHIFGHFKNEINLVTDALDKDEFNRTKTKMYLMNFGDQVLIKLH